MPWQWEADDDGMTIPIRPGNETSAGWLVDSTSTKSIAEWPMQDQQHHDESLERFLEPVEPFALTV